MREYAPTATARPYLPSISVILCLIYIEQTGQTKVCDLYMVRVLHQNISGSQISVDQPDILQITHPLHQHIHTSITHKSMCPQVYKLVPHQM